MKWLYTMSESKEVREIEADNFRDAEVKVWNKEINSLDQPMLTSIRPK